MSEGNGFKDFNYKLGFIEELSNDIADNGEINTCIQCGSCTSSCVAADDMSISPRQLWRSIQMGSEKEAIDSKCFWSCTTCSLCDSRCPRGISLSQIMIKLREHYNNIEGLLPPIEQVSSTLDSKKNITGDNQENRFLWIENMGLNDEKSSKLFKEKADVVYYTGCVASLFPQVYKIPQSLSNILLDMDVNFSLLEEEWCCGFPLMAGGKGIEAVKEYAQHNVEQIRKKGAGIVIVSCPTCYYMFNKIYPKVLDEPMGFKVIHYSEYLAKLIKDSNINFINNEVTVTYHDPCDLGRKQHITKEPRELLMNLPGVKLVEMRFHGEDSKCCGGGGNLEMINPELSLKIAKKRIEEALETNASVLLTTCQQCKRTLQNGARKMRARIKVYDLIEFMMMRYDTADRGEAR